MCMLTPYSCCYFFCLGTIGSYESLWCISRALCSSLTHINIVSTYSMSIVYCYHMCLALLRYATTHNLHCRQLKWIFLNLNHQKYHQSKSHLLILLHPFMLLHDSIVHVYCAFMCLSHVFVWTMLGYVLLIHPITCISKIIIYVLLLVI